MCILPPLWLSFCGHPSLNLEFQVYKVKNLPQIPILRNICSSNMWGIQAQPQNKAMQVAGRSQALGSWWNLSSHSPLRICRRLGDIRATWHLSAASLSLCIQTWTILWIHLTTGFCPQEDHWRRNARKCLNAREQQRTSRPTHLVAYQVSPPARCGRSLPGSQSQRSRNIFIEPHWATLCVERAEAPCERQHSWVYKQHEGWVHLSFAPPWWYGFKVSREFLASAQSCQAQCKVLGEPQSKEVSQQTGSSTLLLV